MFQTHVPPSYPAEQPEAVRELFPKCHVSPPRKITPSPCHVAALWLVTVAQLPEHDGMNGA